MLGRSAVILALGSTFGLAPAVASDVHREAVLRLVTAGALIADVARKGAGALAIRNGPKMSARSCQEFFQDLVSLRDVQVLEVLDPSFKAWQEEGATRAQGYVVLRWRGKRELRLQLRAEGGLHSLEAHGAKPSWPLCSVRAAEPAELESLPRNELAMPKGDAQVFTVDLRNAPSTAPLGKE